MEDDKLIGSKRTQEEVKLPELRAPQKVQKVVENELSNIPADAQRYEVSYMHKDIVNHILAAVKYEFILTISIDGFVKFWKKSQAGITFVKAVKAHGGRVSCAALSQDQTRLATACTKDRTMKLYDVANFDLIYVVNFTQDFVPGFGLEFIN